MKRKAAQITILHDDIFDFHIYSNKYFYITDNILKVEVTDNETHGFPLYNIKRYEVKF
jgi:hypothetical protein